MQPKVFRAFLKVIFSSLLTELSAILHESIFMEINFIRYSTEFPNVPMFPATCQKSTDQFVATASKA